MPKKSHGEGTVSRRKDGRWQGALQVDGVRRTVYGKTRREVQNKLRNLHQQVTSVGNFPNPDGHTVHDLIDAWLEHASSLKPSTIAKYRWFLNTCVRPAIGNLQLDKVTPDRLQRLYTDLAPSVADKVHRVLHRAFKVAVMWRWLASNPCDNVLKPTYKAQPKTLWTRAELDTFLEGTAGHWLNPVWIVLVATGCRLGEALALHWDAVNLDGAVINLSRTLHRIDGEWVLDTVKTDNSNRTLVLPAVAVGAFTRQKHQQDAWKHTARDAWEEWGLVFTGETGKPLSASTVQHAMRRECGRLHLPAVTPHGLRHLHASILLDEGVPITAVSARLGHANPQITMKIYAHALPGQDKRAADAIGDVLGGNGETESRPNPAE